MPANKLLQQSSLEVTNVCTTSFVDSVVNIFPRSTNINKLEIGRPSNIGYLSCHCQTTVSNHSVYRTVTTSHTRHFVSIYYLEIIIGIWVLST